MLKVQRSASIALMMALDGMALVLAFLCVWHLRAGLGAFVLGLASALGYNTGHWVRHVQMSHGVPNWRTIIMSPNPLVNIKHHLWVLYFSLLTWETLLYFQKGYDLGARRSPRQEFAICAYTGMLGTVSLLAFMALSRENTSRLFIVGLLLTGVLFLWLQRVWVLPLAQRNGGRPRRHVLLIGPPEVASRFVHLLSTPAYQWCQLIGYLSETASVVEGSRHLGTLDDLPKVLDKEIIDEVILVRSAQFAAGGVDWNLILELCLERGRTVSLVEDIVPPVNAKLETSMLGQMPVLMLHNTPQNPLALGIKNVMDRVLALATLIIFTFIIPVFPVIAFLVWWHDKGPVFFAQDRVGLNGRVFKFYKFRSMDVNAQAILEKMKREEPEKYRAINIMEEPFFKARDGEDPRITPVGRFIRKYSLDELPQFINVLKGDMSLVGPRPPLPKEVAELQPWQRRKLSVKGGLTCIWQATGRNDITNADEWMKLDLEYIDNWSLWLDIKLLVKTVKVLVAPRGAS